MHINKSTESGLITTAGTSFHRACNDFFDLVDWYKAARIYICNISGEPEREVISYFKEILDGTPEDAVLLGRFAEFQFMRFKAYKQHSERFFPCNRELEIVRPSRGLWGTVDSIEYLNDDETEDKLVVEYKSGMLTDWRKSKLRRELAVYKLLLDDTRMAPVPVKHIGAFCAGNENYRDGCLYEKLKSQTITALFKVIKEIRTTFEKAWIAPGQYDIDYFPVEASAFCMLCNYSEVCYGGQ
jgi:hypothetical protein